MGEEEKKSEEKKVEEKKEEEAKKPEGGGGGGGGGGGEEKKEEKEAKKPDEDKKDDKKPEEAEAAKEEAKEPPPPEEIVLKVYMHCEGCARKVKRCLKGFEGVEDVQTDCKTHKVIVKGKTADPLKVLDKVQRKSHRQVELLSPIPKPPSEEEKKAAEEKNKENVKPDQEKKEEPQVIIVVLKVHMHCEACAQEIQKRIQRMKGVQEAKADLKSSQVTVKGVFDPAKLVEYVYKRTGKHAVIIKTEPEKKEEAKKEGEVEKKEEKAEGEKEKKKEGEAKAEGGEEAKAEAEEEKVETMELKRNEFYYYPPKYPMEYVYAPQIFSDENPNACSIV